jgi:hypothetical protein
MPALAAARGLAAGGQSKYGHSGLLTGFGKPVGCSRRRQAYRRGQARHLRGRALLFLGGY